MPSFLRPIALTALLSAWSMTASALTPSLDDLDVLPLHVAPAAVTAKALAERPPAKGQGPYIVAVNVALPVALDGGIWDQADDGRARWRTRVYSAGARSLLMAFDRFALPAGAQLWIYDADGQAVQGPYSEANENVDGTLWTPTVPGETAVIELRVPQAQRKAVELHLATLGHGFKNSRDLGSSGSCNIDSVCPLGNDWRDEIRSAVKLQIPDGQFVILCSGTLLNNLRGNGKPYVLTANHCGIGDFNSPASGVVTYWNFANTVCNGADNASDTQNQTGASLRASDAETDFTLLELAQKPAGSFNVHYAGWDASGGGGNFGVGIHHPQGDAKKISEYTTPLVAATVQIEELGPQIPVWRVDHWNQGVTEVGSSGSALWNQDHHIVGTLSGGAAACSGSGNNGEADYYARLDRQWTANTASNGQLKAWLDPDSCGLLSVAGGDAGELGSTVSPGAGCGANEGSSGGASAPGWLSLMLVLAGLRRSFSRANGSREPAGR